MFLCVVNKLPVYRFGSTNKLGVRFCALLADGTPEVRFERVTMGLWELSIINKYPAYRSRVDPEISCHR